MYDIKWIILCLTDKKERTTVMEQSKKRQLTGVLIAGMALLACIFALHGSLLTRTIDFYGLTDALQGMPSAAASAGGFVALISSLMLSGRFSKLTL